MSILPSGALPTDRPPSASVGGTGVIPDGSITAAKLADGVAVNAVRRGALFDGDATAKGLVSWGPSTTSGSYRFKYQRGESHGAAARDLLGTIATGRQLIHSTNVGFKVWPDVSQTNGTVPVSDSDMAELAEYEFHFSPTAWSMDRDGVEVAAGTGTYTIATTVTGVNIGSSGGSGAPYGTLYDVKLIDPADDTNTAVYTLDGPSGFENSHPGSTVADATVTGNVSYALVPSSDGGRPVKVGREVYLHSWSSTTDRTISGADHSVAFNTIELDETGSAATNTTPFTAPVDGTIVTSVSFFVPANSDASDEVRLQLKSGGVAFVDQRLELGSVSSGYVASVSGAATIAAGDALKCDIKDVMATTTTFLIRPHLTVAFYPTPT